MRTMDQIESIRRASHVEEKSIQAVARELGHGRHVIRAGATAPTRHLTATG